MRVRRDERFWKERVQQWTASGLSAREFADREGLRRERLFFWKRRLRGNSVMASGVSFAKVEIQPSQTRPEPTCSALEVVTRLGHTVRVGADFDEGVLRRLLIVLGGA